MLLSDWLKSHARGDLDVECGEQLAELGEAVALHRKKGTLSLTITIDQSGRMLETYAETKLKAPQALAESSMWYVGQDGLTKQDPLQDAGMFSPENLQERPSRVDPKTGEITTPTDTEE